MPRKTPCPSLPAHTRSAGDRLIVRYLPERKIVRLLRNYHVWEEAELPPGPCQLRMEYRANGDVFEPCAGVRWQAEAGDQRVSGFGFEAGGTRGTAARLSLSHVRVEGKD